MIFNRHLDLAGRHALLSASKHHWINYDDDKMIRAYTTAMAAQRGTELHELAHNLIRLGVKLPKTKTTLSMYVNDAIGYRMTPEQVLFYSENAFGTADAISFRKNMLRVHDYKSGVTPCSPDQTYVYCALFCLEYGFNPFEITMETRIYQNDEVYIYEVDPDVIMHIMEKIKSFDRLIKELRMEDRK